MSFSCASKPEDPMIIPPGFDEIPTEENIKANDNITESKSEELENLKKLLLKN